MYKTWWLYILVQLAAILQSNLEITIVTGSDDCTRKFAEVANANLLKRVLAVHGSSS